jgi:hypothetical protein
MPTTFCRHIRPSGRRCQSPALRSSAFCYYHEKANAHLRTLHPLTDGTYNCIDPTTPDCDAIRRSPLLSQFFAETRTPLKFVFPPLEDAESVQLSLSMVLSALGQDRVEPRRAASMLYNLQIAAGNVKRLTGDPAATVTDSVLDPNGTPIAPDEDPQEVIELQTLLQEIEDEKAARRKRRQEDEDWDGEEDEDDEEEDNEDEDVDDEDEDEL